jgi:hypothetical protein
MSRIRNKQVIESLVEIKSDPSTHAQASVARSRRFKIVFRKNLNKSSVLKIPRVTQHNR